MIDPRDIDRLRRDRTLFDSVLRDLGTVPAKGDTVRCPFHGDKTASAKIYKSHESTWRLVCFACHWNGDRRDGDIFDLVAKRDGLDFKAACERLGLVDDGKLATNGHADGSPGSNRDAQTPTKRVSLPAVERSAPGVADDTPRNENGQEGVEYEHLWRTRGIDEVTARRFGIGMVGKPGTRYWTMPVAYGVTKSHAADGQSPKSWWKPDGTSSAKVWPVSLDGPGPIWLCPGELKALAVIACGGSAIGICCGEGGDLPPAALELVRGKAVVLPIDNDPVGMTWGTRAAKRLAGVAAEIRILMLPELPRKGDVGDFIVQLRQAGKSADEIRSILLAHYESAPVVAVEAPAAAPATEATPDPWAGTSIGDLWQSPRTWRKATYIKTGFQHLDARTCGGLRTSAVHGFMGKTGSCKSQFVVQLSVNAARNGTPTGFFSAELGADEIAQLMASQISGVSRIKLATGALGVSGMSNLQTSLAACGDIPLHVLDGERWPGGLTRALLARLVADGCERFGWKLIVLDYFNLVAPDETDRDLHTTEVQTSTLLRHLARKFDVAIVPVCAVRKGANKKESDFVSLDDLMGASRLAYDATSVFYVFRSGGEMDSGFVHVHAFKQRFAPLGGSTIQLRWRPSTGSITDLPRDERAGNTDDYDADEEARSVEEIKNDDEEKNGGVPF